MDLSEFPAGLYRCPADFYPYSLGNWAISAWVLANPSVQWAQKQIEPWKGLPFGPTLREKRPRRQRALTGPLDPSEDSFMHRLQVFMATESAQHTSSQPHCAFLTKLPLEIRLIIYEMVLGGMAFHLQGTESRARILHNVCRVPGRINEPQVHGDCHIATTQRPSSAPRDDYETATGLLPLLVTCRVIYSEAIETLYGSNAFEFTQNWAAFRFLKITIPPQRLHCIRHFRLYFRLPHHPVRNGNSKRDWVELWNFFSQEMTGLTKLHLRLLLMQPTEALIKGTDDNSDEAVNWIKPMLLMAVEANRKRGCKVEIVTNGVVHDLHAIWKVTGTDNATRSPEDIMGFCCATVHERIRLSLGGDK
ncbi:hypothetical protein MBLNU230_g4614t1 [Neophaeotheca triangularis]